MKSGFGLFKNIQSISTKINSRVETFRSNLGEGVDILKSVVIEIKNEINSQEKLSFQNIFDHAIRFLLMVVNECSSELKSLTKYLALEALKFFRASVSSLEAA